MKVSEVGEFGLIGRIAAGVSKPDASVLLGIGDDAAVWISPSQPTIATTDALLEGIHFDLRFTTWYELGWKALAANISDVAAMGGVPQYALVALGLPKYAQVEAVEELYRGMSAVGDAFGAVVVGGDIVHSPDRILLSVSLLGHALEVAPKGKKTDVAPFLTRSAALPGDLIAVTGNLGASAAGLYMLQSGRQLEPDVETTLRRAHLKPYPRVKEGQILLKAGVKAAMDISDGTVGDLAKMCQASGVGARIWLDKLPIRDEVRLNFPDRYQGFALYGGEDYELLFTAPPKIIDRAAELVRGGTGTEVTVIGEIIAGNVGRVALVEASGAERLTEAGGYDHFAAST